MALDFPSAPTVGQVYGGWVWDGEKWLVQGTATARSVRYDVAQGLDIGSQSQGRANVGATKKNYIINGAMRIAQQYGTTVIGGDVGSYAADMFCTAGSFTPTSYMAVKQRGTLGGSSFVLDITSGSTFTATANQDFRIQTAIEGWRYAELWRNGPKTITLRFGVNTGIAGTYSVSFRNKNITGAGVRSYVAEYTISAAEVGKDVLKTITIDTDSVTTNWAWDSGAGLYIGWALLNAISYRNSAGVWRDGNWTNSVNQTNWSVNNNRFTLFDVGLYEGSVAPPYVVEDFDTEQQMCKRYFQIVGCGAVGSPDASDNVVVGVAYKQMRASPSFFMTNSSPRSLELATQWRDSTGSVITGVTPTRTGSLVTINGFTTPGNVLRMNILGTDCIGLSARI